MKTLIGVENDVLIEVSRIRSDSSQNVAAGVGKCHCTRVFPDMRICYARITLFCVARPGCTAVSEIGRPHKALFAVNRLPVNHETTR